MDLSMFMMYVCDLHFLKYFFYYRVFRIFRCRYFIQYFDIFTDIILFIFNHFNYKLLNYNNKIFIVFNYYFCMFIVNYWKEVSILVNESNMQKESLSCLFEQNINKYLREFYVKYERFSPPK